MYYSKFTGAELQSILDVIISTLFHSMDILLTDEMGKVLFLTDGMVKDMGASPDVLLGATVSDLMKNNVYSQSATMMSLRSGMSKSTITRNAHGDISYGNSTLIRNEQGAVQYVLTQGTSIHTLIKMLDELITTQGNIQELSELVQRLKEQGQQVIFRSDLMYRIVKQADRIASSSSNVLITGESGVGKDVFATYIYRKSDRAQKTFLPICVPAISPTLLEAELFGYVGGAFTNASKVGKQGLFEAANGGTVFLDEIGDIPLELQVKLLRVLETQEIFRVGGTVPIKLDIRILSATNKNLIEMVESGQFRRDLYYRINTLSLEIPPLRDRPSDVRPLSDFFLTQMNERHLTNRRFSDDAYQTMEQYPWPGNVRELRHVIEKMSIVIESDIWDGESVKKVLPPLSTPRASYDSAPITLADNGKNEIARAIELIDRAERQRIADALLACNGSKAEAAKMLNYSRSRLYRKLKKWKLSK